jgi:hypothetical protein
LIWQVNRHAPVHPWRVVRKGAASVGHSFKRGAMKILASIREIQAEVQRRIDVSTWANGYCVGCSAPTPWRIPHDGTANWMAHPGSTERHGCEGFILEVIAAVRKVLEVIAAVRKDYDLPPQPLSAAIARPGGRMAPL